MQILALKNLGLNIRRAKIRPDDVKNRLNKFFITDARTAEKITKSKRLEDIRMTILENLLHYHPDAAEDLGIGPKAKRPSSRDYLHPLGPKARSESHAPLSFLTLQQKSKSGRPSQLNSLFSLVEYSPTHAVHQIDDRLM